MPLYKLNKVKLKDNTKSLCTHQPEKNLGFGQQLTEAGIGGFEDQRRVVSGEDDGSLRERERKQG